MTHFVRAVVVCESCRLNHQAVLSALQGSALPCRQVVWSTRDTLPIKDKGCCGGGGAWEASVKPAGLRSLLRSSDPSPAGLRSVCSLLRSSDPSPAGLRSVCSLLRSVKPAGLRSLLRSSDPSLRRPASRGSLEGPRLGPTGSGKLGVFLR